MLSAYILCLLYWQKISIKTRYYYADLACKFLPEEQMGAVPTKTASLSICFYLEHECHVLKTFLYPALFN